MNFWLPRRGEVFLSARFPAGSTGRFSRPGNALLLSLIYLLFSLVCPGPARGDEPVIFAFGDSITEGWDADTGSEEAGGYVTILDELLDTQVEESVVYNFGVGGETTANGLARLPFILSFIGDRILIMFGTNDISWGISINTALFNLEQMLNMCLADGTAPMISTIIPRLDDPRDPDNALAQQLNAGIALLAQQDGVEFCDNWEVFYNYLPSLRALYSDRLHPNALGYQVMAETWLGALGRLYPPPFVNTISPTGMVNGLPVPVSITGGNFLPGAVPHLDQTELVFVVVPSSGTISATVPAELPPGVYDVVVLNPGGVAGTLANGFTITNSPPEIYSITPDTLEAGQRARVTVQGRFIEPGAQLSAGVFGFDQVNVISDSTLRALTPDDIAVGTYDVRLSNPDGQTDLLANSFTVVDTGEPEIGNYYPAPGSSGASRRTGIRFNLRDSGSGINIGSLNMVVNGSAVIPTSSGTPGDYFVEYQPPTQYAFGQTVSVSVGVNDFNQPTPNALSVLYNFTVTGSADSDADNLPDGWETANSLDPGNPLGLDGTAGDPDRDLLGNLAEYNGGSDPTSPWQVVTGPGPGPGSRPLIRLWDTSGVQLGGVEWTPYGGGDWGADVAAGDIDGDGRHEVLTGPGPGPIYGPQVRGFEADGTQVPGVNFFAYGTNRYGVRVTAGDVDGDGVDEIVTGAGPGEVFGPHVRAFDVSGSLVQSLPGINFFAYGTLKYGVNVACGDLDGDGVDEIVTGAGPGAVFGPHVRAFSYNGAGVSAVPGVSYFAYGTLKYGVNVACGDLDGDGIDEIVTGAGPGVVFGPHVRGWNVDGHAAAAIPGVSFFAFSTDTYGVNVACGDVDGDRRDEIITGTGPGPTFAAQVRGWKLDHGSVQEIPGMNFFAYDPFVYTYGARVAAGHFYY